MEEQIERFSLSEIASSSISEISGGQLQRALLARALIQEPNDPFSG
ncbi:MAG: hypothetical protein U5N56_01385 [Candidatus Marinimicrobia bacterium]|nr:hypothetical protein [Candidatus Neomarinimicrobiota bacterium]